MRLTLRVKLLLSFIVIIMTAVSASSWYFYYQTKEIIIGQMADRVRDVVKTGTFLLNDEDRNNLSKIIEQIKNDSRRKVLSAKDLANIPKGDDYLSLSKEVSHEYMSSPEFLGVIQKLRQIKIASRKRLRSLSYINQSDMYSIKGDKPIINYVYILAPLPESRNFDVLIFIADSDYEVIGEEEGNPIGNLFKSKANAFKYAMLGYPFSERKFDSDKWGTWLTGAAPILNEENEVIAILGIDYDAGGEVNKIKELEQILVVILIIAFLFAFPLPMIISRSLTRPISDLTKAADKIKNRDFNIKINIKNKDEVGTLAGAFNAMAVAIKDYSSQMEKLNKSYFKFVPKNFLKYLGINNIVNLKLGDQSQREMTVLFSDIRHFTTISEKMSPKENFTFLNEYLSKVGPVIRKYNGFIDKYIGDAIMALFPLSVDDAIQASIHMRSALGEYNLNNKEKNNIQQIEIGIGINTGKLMLGTIGEEERMETTVISDTVNLASRLEGETKRLEAPIIISDFSFNKIVDKSQFSMRYIGKTIVKGKSKLTHLFQVLTPGDTLSLYEETKDEFENAVRLYLESEIKKAKELFEAILIKNPTDSVCKSYISICRGS